MSDTEGSTLHTGNDLATALQAGRDLAGISARVGVMEHPDDHETTIPIVLNDEEHGPTVRVALDALSQLDARLPGPRRRLGVFAFSEVDSLIEYVKRYSDANTLAYADTKNFGVAVVLDDHPAGPAVGGGLGFAAWRGHRASYQCPRSPEWILWSALDGVAQTQEKFADFIESRLEDITTAKDFPAATEVLTMARALMVRTKGTYQKEFNPTTGDSVLVNKTETDTGSTVIPRAFILGIPVFEGGAPYRVEARLRFGFTEGGKPAFAFVLHRRKEIERDAFGEVRTKIAKETGVVLLAGTP